MGIGAFSAISSSLMVVLSISSTAMCLICLASLLTLGVLFLSVFSAMRSASCSAFRAAALSSRALRRIALGKVVPSSVVVLR